MGIPSTLTGSEREGLGDRGGNLAAKKYRHRSTCEPGKSCPSERIPQQYDISRKAFLGILRANQLIGFYFRRQQIIGVLYLSPIS
jgi:hypothetical protein